MPQKNQTFQIQFDPSVLSLSPSVIDRYRSARIGYGQNEFQQGLVNIGKDLDHFRKNILAFNEFQAFTDDDQEEFLRGYSGFFLRAVTSIEQAQQLMIDTGLLDQRCLDFVIYTFIQNRGTMKNFLHLIPLLLQPLLTSVFKISQFDLRNDQEGIEFSPKSESPNQEQEDDANREQWQWTRTIPIDLGDAPQSPQEGGGGFSCWKVGMTMAIDFAKLMQCNPILPQHIAEIVKIKEIWIEFELNEANRFYIEPIVRILENVEVLCDQLNTAEITDLVEFYKALSSFCIYSKVLMNGGYNCLIRQGLKDDSLRSVIEAVQKKDCTIDLSANPGITRTGVVQLLQAFGQQKYIVNIELGFSGFHNRRQPCLSPFILKRKDSFVSMQLPARCFETLGSLFETLSQFKQITYIVIRDNGQLETFLKALSESDATTFSQFENLLRRENFAIEISSDLSEDYHRLIQAMSQRLPEDLKQKFIVRGETIIEWLSLSSNDTSLSNDLYEKDLEPIPMTFDPSLSNDSFEEDLEPIPMTFSESLQYLIRKNSTSTLEGTIDLPEDILNASDVDQLVEELSKKKQYHIDLIRRDLNEREVVDLLFKLSRQYHRFSVFLHRERVGEIESFSVHQDTGSVKVHLSINSFNNLSSLFEYLSDNAHIKEIIISEDKAGDFLERLTCSDPITVDRFVELMGKHNIRIDQPPKYSGPKIIFRVSRKDYAKKLQNAFKKWGWSENFIESFVSIRLGQPSLEVELKSFADLNRACLKEEHDILRYRFLESIESFERCNGTFSEADSAELNDENGLYRLIDPSELITLDSFKEALRQKGIQDEKALNFLVFFLLNGDHTRRRGGGLLYCGHIAQSFLQKVLKRDFSVQCLNPKNFNFEVEENTVIIKICQDIVLADSTSHNVTINTEDGHETDKIGQIESRVTINLHPSTMADFVRVDSIKVKFNQQLSNAPCVKKIQDALREMATPYIEEVYRVSSDGYALSTLFGRCQNQHSEDLDLSDVGLTDNDVDRVIELQRERKRCTIQLTNNPHVSANGARNLMQQLSTDSRVSVKLTKGDLTDGHFEIRKHKGSCDVSLPTFCFGQQLSELFKELSELDRIEQVYITDSIDFTSEFNRQCTQDHVVQSFRNLLCEKDVCLQLPAKLQDGDVASLKQSLEAIGEMEVECLGYDAVIDRLLPEIIKMDSVSVKVTVGSRDDLNALFRRISSFSQINRDKLMIMTTDRKTAERILKNPYISDENRAKLLEQFPMAKTTTPWKFFRGRTGLTSEEMARLAPHASSALHSTIEARA